MAREHLKLYDERKIRKLQRDLRRARQFFFLTGQAAPRGVDMAYGGNTESNGPGVSYAVAMAYGVCNWD